MKETKFGKTLLIMFPFSLILYNWKTFPNTSKIPWQIKIYNRKGKDWNTSNFPMVCQKIIMNII